MKGGYVYKKRPSRTRKHKRSYKARKTKSKKQKSKLLKQLRKLTRKSFTY